MTTCAVDVGNCDRVYFACGAGAGRYEKADRLFFGGAYGLCHHGYFCRQSTGHRRRDLSDDQPRLYFGRLFLCVGVIYDRMHSREIAAYGGLVNRMPAYALIFMLFTMANVGLPGTSGFVGEFLTLLAFFRSILGWQWWPLLA